MPTYKPLTSQAYKVSRVQLVHPTSHTSKNHTQHFGGESLLVGSIIDVFLAGYRILTGRFY